MRLYTGTSETLIKDTQLNQIADKLKSEFFQQLRRAPSQQEVMSWQHSLAAMSNVLIYSRLKNLGVVLEYQLPKAMQRLDCMFTGIGDNNKENAVIVELKQWQTCSPSEGANEVRTWLAGSERDVQHPASQVGGYRRYLKDGNTAFYEGDDHLNLDACSFLHNYPFSNTDHIFDKKFVKLLEKYPVFTKDDVPRLSDYLRARLHRGEGVRVLNRLDQGHERPNRKLLEHVARMIDGEPAFVLLDEQRVVYDLILAKALKKFDQKQKTAFLIKGGPGTGKSLIAINLLADLMLQGKDAYYATGSRAFTNTLQKIVGPKAQQRFIFFMNAGSRDVNSIDVLVADEAHRIRKDNNIRFTKAELRDERPQVETLLNCAKVPVFFIDDRQLVRPDEKGSTEIIREAANRLGIRIEEFQLDGQFRCGGSEGFVQWIDNTLSIARTPTVMWDQSQEVFDFRIFGSPEELDREIRKKSENGASARLTAGFCWPWAKQTNSDGTLKEDVVCGNFRRPWNAPPDAAKLASGIPKANLWAYEAGGIDQVGCVYTAQGFEFDYVGVIFGEDLRYDFDSQDWVGDKTKSHDSVVKKSGDAFLNLVKNTYRVLLTRGLKGCYVYFLDKNTERFVKSRMERVSTSKVAPASKIVSDPGAEAFVSFLPIYSLKVAAGHFGESAEVAPEGWMRVSEQGKLDRNQFVARVVGRSMEPLIPNGSYCIFRFHQGGSRQGRIVLVQNKEISDEENGGSYTVKTYHSEKVFDGDDNWKHAKIILSPKNPDFRPIVFNAENENEVKVVAEFVRTIGSI